MMGEIDANTDQLIISALKQAILHGEPVRLYKSTTKGEGLFPTSLAKSGEVESLCLTGDSPLFVKCLGENETSHSVALGPGAFEFLATKLDPATLSEWLSEGLKKVTKRLQDARRYWAGVVAQNHATLEALELIRNRALLHQETRTQILLSKLLKEPIKVESEEDFDSARRFGVHLVNALKLGGTIEAVLHNTGFERIAKAGDRVPFNPRWHTSEHSILPGTMVVIEANGWLLRMEKVQYVLDKATVRPANDNERSPQLSTD